MDTQAQKLRHKENREAAEILVLSGPDGFARNFLMRKFSKAFAETGQIPVHVEMYRKQIEDNVIPLRPVQEDVKPCDTEKAKLQEKWGKL